MHLTWAGWVMALPSLVMLLALLFNLVHKHRRILLEESHLERVHGQSYREYLRKVGRYL
jgi:protein-S-isoprenylcysteine O-methyltransferase Ste14